MKRTGAQIVWEMLEREGVEIVFGFPGGYIIHTYHCLPEYANIHHVLVRHEQGAATPPTATRACPAGSAWRWRPPGQARQTWSPVSPTRCSIRCRWSASPPGARPCDRLRRFPGGGHHRHHATHHKHNYLVTDVEDLAAVIHEAFYVARSGRPGPVLIDLPRSVQMAETEFTPRKARCACRATRTRGRAALKPCRQQSR